MDRRSVIRTALATGAVGMAGVVGPRDADARVIGTVRFSHGVASGDPTADSVILWTRVLNDSGVDLGVEWKVSTTPDMGSVVRSGLAEARASRDFTVKVDATGLAAGQTYYYQFGFRDALSPVGVTRTLPVGATAEARFAVFSCANYERGYFNVYTEVAKRDDLTAVIHLGDYIYEYGPGGYGPTPAEMLGLVRPVRGAAVQPQKECTTLADYRQRYATYRGDPALQEVHRKNPWIVVWDDHEVANDAWHSGAENHDPEAGEGAWADRVAAAVQAYHEWLPIRDRADGNLLKIWRSFDFGDLARLVMVDTRLIARDRQLAAEPYIGNWTSALQGGGYPYDRLADGQTRTLLGAEQEAYVAERMTGAPQTWQILGNQVLVHYEAAVDIAGSPRLTDAQRAELTGLLEQLFPGQSQTIVQLGAAGLPLPDTSDWWIGYPTARDALYRILAASKNPVVLTGDTHNAWGVNLRAPTAAGFVNVGVELATPAVSSPGYEETVPVVAPATAAGLIADASQILDQMVYANTHQRGWMVLDVTHERVRNEWYMVSTVFSEAYTVTLDRVVEVPRGAKAISTIV
ncbi:alkaline phosphatase D family protein [Azospirillum sp. ST 5-10]|uniref:alkaline phosphatase D family protein n=1 Tax=unclassified Azospirillum TaxID=2630922 RepID=UPI003F4A7FA4